MIVDIHTKESSIRGIVDVGLNTQTTTQISLLLIRIYEHGTSPLYLLYLRKPNQIVTEVL